jgi:hypothetical protein
MEAAKDYAASGDDHATAWAADRAALLANVRRLEARIEAAGLLAFQIMQSAAAVQADPTKANAVAASWVIGKVGAVLAALRGEEKP